MMTDKQWEPQSSVKLRRYTTGRYHLSIEMVTLHLTQHELALIGSAINRMAERQPALAEMMQRTQSTISTDETKDTDNDFNQ